MAGDWIKMRVDLGDDPAVILIAAQTGISEDEVVGKLHRIWSWADKHTTDGVAPAITPAWVDRYCGREGFAAAMVKAGWLSFTETGVVFPNFDRHNGKSAKTRCENTERKRLSRVKRGKKTEMSQKNCDNAVTKVRPEKRREENNNTPIVPLKGTNQLRAEKIFRRRPETPLTEAEKRAFRKNRAAIEATSEADWQLLERFYALPQSETFARKDLATLVNNWNGEIDRARKYFGTEEPHRANYVV